MAENAAPAIAGNKILRCPRCKGLNRAGAEWCGQCHARFLPRTSPPAPRPPAPPPPGTAAGGPPKESGRSGPTVETFAGAHRPPETFAVAQPSFGPVSDPLFDPAPPDEGSMAPATGRGEAPPIHVPALSAEEIRRQAISHHGVAGVSAHAGAGPFRVGDNGISWTCSTCSCVNPLAAHHCSTCGATFADLVRPVEPAAGRAGRDPNTTAMVALFFPGAGHAYLGMWGQAVARAAMSLWVVAAALAAAVERSLPNSFLLAIIFGMASIALWAVDAHDAYREAAGQGNLAIMKGRMFMYVTLGLLGLLGLGLMVSVLGTI